MNTGKKIYRNLIEINNRTGLPTGNVKPNLPEDPDYIPPTEDFEACPLNGSSDPSPLSRKFVVNLTGEEACPSSMCTVGNQHLSIVYSDSISIAPETQLYSDVELTQPLSTYRWIRQIDTDTIYSLTQQGVVSEEEILTCPID